MDFNVEPYYDDFEGDSGAREQNYMRILFRPGYAVQARELTQMQSILQNQIRSFGDHIFKDGSPVQGGHLTFDKAATSIFLNASDDLALSSFKDQIITNAVGESTKKAVVIAVDDTVETSTIGGALLVRYLTAGNFVDNEQIELLDAQSITATTLAANSTFIGSVASINEGIFYVDGFFVYVPTQTLVLDSKSTTPTYKVGLEIDENIIEESTDSNLLDPAQESFNYQAPGANRYQFKLNLTKRTLDSTDTTKFFELLRIENGIITKQVDYPLYSELNKTLARRTDDQSGSFTVRPFSITTTEDESNSDNYIINIEPGKAYVKGYEFETIGATKFQAPKARSVSTSIDYDLSMEYGNFFICTNIRNGTNGFFNMYNFGSADLHLVPSANVLPNTATAYGRTKIGSVKIRNVEYAGVSGSGEPTYYVYVLDANARPLLVNATGGSTTTLTFPASMSSANNAYANVKISIIAGPGSPYDGTITSYSEVTKVATVAPPIINGTPTVNTKVSLNFGIKDAKSIVMAPNVSFGLTQVFASQNANSAHYPSIEIVGKNEYGTSLFETNRNTLIYKFPESYLVRGDVMKAMTIRHRRYLADQTFTSGGTLTLTSGTSPMSSYEKFVFGATGTVSSITSGQNVLLMVKNKLNSNLVTGQVITFDGGANSITAVTPDSQIQIKINANNAFVADLFVTVEIEGANSALRRTKTLVGNSSIYSLRSTDSIPTASVTGASGVKYDSANGFIWFTPGGQLDRLKVTGARQSLYVPDAINILGIYDSGSPTYAPNTTNAIDITDRYLFDSGQRDNYYENASIFLRQGASAPDGQVVVLAQYYNHSGTGFFSVDSYDAAAYNNNLIPYYASEKSGIYLLRDCIDFRPSRTQWVNPFITSTLQGTYLPYPYFNMEIGQYQFYLPRIDKLVLTTEGEFKLLQGEPSAFPKVPVDIQNAMTLYKLTIPPYTPQAREIPIEYVDNRRYTMKDIGVLKDRIENLEYYTSLNLLETMSSRQAIYGLDGFEKSKLGFLVDQFDGYNVADNKSADLVCYMNENELSAYKIINSVAFNFKPTESTGLANKKRTTTLQYTETPFVSQIAASNTVSVQPHEFANYIGNLFLTPQSDSWYSTVLVPEIIAPANDTVRRELPPARELQTSVQASSAAGGGGGGGGGGVTSTVTSTPPIGGTVNPISVTPKITFQIPWTMSDATLNIPADLTGFGIMGIQNWMTLNREKLTELASSQSRESQVPVNSGGSLNLAPGGGIIGTVNDQNRTSSTQMTKDRLIATRISFR